MNLPTLKPCPYCKLHKQSIVRHGEDDDPYWAVHCLNCGARGPDINPDTNTDGNYTKADAEQAWNTRNG